MKNILNQGNQGSAVPSSNTGGAVSNLVHGVGGTTGQATSDVGGTGGHLLSNVANTVGNTLKGAGNTTSSTGGPIGNTAGGILGGTGSALGTGGSALGGVTSGISNAVGSAVNNLSGNTPMRSGQLPLGTNFPTSGFGNTHMGSTYAQQGINTSGISREVHIAPTVFVEKVEKPVIVKETILPEEKIEIQPIIHREREQLEVHEVVQPLHERDIAPTLVRHETLPAQVKAEFRESDASFQTSYREATTRHIPEVHTEATRREFLNRPAIVEEHIQRKIVEEIQPVLYKETIAPVLIEETQPIYEKIVEAPIIIEETRQVVDLGTKYHSEGYPVSQMGNLSLGGHQPMLHKETTITKETFLEPTQRADRKSVV